MNNIDAIKGIGTQTQGTFAIFKSQDGKGQEMTALAATIPLDSSKMSKEANDLLGNNQKAQQNQEQQNQGQQDKGIMSMFLELFKSMLQMFSQMLNGGNQQNQAQNQQNQAQNQQNKTANFMLMSLQ